MQMIGALVAGIMAGMICGVLIEMLRTQGDKEMLEAQLAQSIPKIKVIQAINRNKMDAKALKQKRKDRSNEYWNGGIEAVWFDLKDDLR